jgi:PIN domain nuclease of toxin-antitoxin system
MSLSHLLDTATLLWAVSAPENLSDIARRICTAGDAEPAVSAVSLMELIEKAQKRKLKLDPDPVQWWNHHVRLLGFSVLPLRPRHVEKLWLLPSLHPDLADRLLIAQALAEGVPLVSGDPAMRQYSVDVVW